MNLPPRSAGLQRLIVKDKPVLALDTGFSGDSLEGLRLVKASRGQGWVFHDGQLQSWVTKGVLQHDGHLVVWGDAAVPGGTNPGSWPLSGAEGLDFLRALVTAWTARATAPEPLPAFSPSAVLPWRVDGGWAFVFPPADLRVALDSLVPLDERLAWDHVRHPDLEGAPSWAFASAALGWVGVGVPLPWAQDDDEHLRQELRDLKKTLEEDELPRGPDPTTLGLWYASLTGRGGSLVDGWRAWAAESHPWTGTAGTDDRRRRRRSGAAFWRRRGTLVTAGAGALAAVLFVVGSVVWGAVKPDPTDTWTPEQVVQGYYAALDDLDGELLKKLSRGTKDPTGVLSRDQDSVNSLYVIRQVRTAYEQKSPILPAQRWEASGRPPLAYGQLLYGVADPTFEAQGPVWTVRYHLWVTESEGDAGPRARGEAVVDVVTLADTDRGWKVSSIHRDRQPLP